LVIYDWSDDLINKLTDIKNYVNKKNMNYRNIQRSSASEQVMKAILGNIKEGTLKPGEKLPTERKLAKMFGVGRSTVREAVSALAVVGYLEVIQGSGTFLKMDVKSGESATFDFSDIQVAANIIDLVEVREILECNAVKLAARRAEPEDLERIEGIVTQMKKTVADFNAFTPHDCDFHIALAQATGNATILEMMKGIVKKIHNSYGNFKSRSLFQTETAVFTAEKIVACIKNGDGEEASRQMYNHLRLVTTGLKQMIPQVRKQGKAPMTVQGHL